MSKLKNYFMMVLILFSSFAGININGIVDAAAKDDPGVTIKGPNSIGSSDQVELDVTLSASSGKINQDGDVNITIPKAVVRNSGDLVNNIVIGDPFYLGTPAVTVNANGDYVLNIKYDHTKIDQSSAFGATFKIIFKAPIFYDNDETVPGNAHFSVDLNQEGKTISSDNATSSIVKTNDGNPLLSKWSTRPNKVVNGVKSAIMSLSKPSSNIFAIAVNYNQQNIKNASIVDKVPAGTQLNDPDHYIPATGNDQIINHFRIAKVTARDANNLPSAWVYVTDQFKNKISITSDGFKIDFGDINSSDSYVVMYAEKITAQQTPSEFGVRYNHVDLYSGDDKIKDYDTAIALDDSVYNALSLKKSVSQASLSTTKASLDYTLDLKNTSGVIPAGTKISDPLPQNVTFKKTLAKDSNIISDVKIDSLSNTISYTTLKDIPQGTLETIKFNVEFDSKNAKDGDKIINKAYLNYAGTNIYSNDATTILDGSAELTKVDVNNGKKLSGATFKVVDSNNKVVLDNLISDQNGLVKTGLLAPGQYAFIETKAPNGYVLDATPNPFTVKSGQEEKVELTMNNSVMTSITGTKIWIDDDDSAGLRPKFITIDLYRNGKLFKTTQANEQSKWKYSFTGLSKYDSNGREYQYKVKEEIVKNYESHQDGNNFTNTLVKIDIPTKPANPKVDIPTKPVNPKVDIPTKPVNPKVDIPTKPANPKVDIPTKPVNPKVDIPTKPVNPKVDIPTKPVNPKVDIPTKPVNPRVDIPTKPVNPKVDIPTKPANPKVDIPTKPENSNNRPNSKSKGDNIVNDVVKNVQTSLPKTSAQKATLVGFISTVLVLIAGLVVWKKRK